MKLSFVIPCYNVEKYLIRCVDSIASQCLNMDYEIIIVDDNSNDRTFEVANGIQNPRVQVLKTPESKGYAGQPRNIGLAAAKGKFVCFIDPDDFYIGNGIVNAIEKFGEYDVIVNSYAVASENAETLDYRITGVYQLACRDYDYQVNYHEATSGVCLQRTIFKRAFLLENKLEFNENLPSQDSMFMLDVVVFKPKVKITNELTTVYICDRVGSVTNVFTESKIINGIKAMNELGKKIELTAYTDREKSRLKGIYFNRYVEKIENDITDTVLVELKKSVLYEFYARRRVLDV